MNGHLTAILIIIMYAICMLFTSVVIRVTRLEEENLSTFENEKYCILQNMSLRKFFAKPQAAVAQ